MMRYQYSRGCNPNSLKALEKNRHKGMFTKKQSEAAAEKSVILRRILNEAVVYGMFHESDDDWETIIAKVWEALKDAAFEGNMYALKELWKRL